MNIKRLAVASAVLALMVVSLHRSIVADVPSNSITYQLFDRGQQEAEHGRQLIETVRRGSHVSHQTIFVMPVATDEHQYHGRFVSNPLIVSARQPTTVTFVVGLVCHGSVDQLVFLDRSTGRCRIGWPDHDQPLPPEWGTTGFSFLGLHQLAPTKDRPIAILATIRNAGRPQDGEKTLVFVPTSRLVKLYQDALELGPQIARLNRTLERLVTLRGRTRAEFVARSINHPVSDHFYYPVMRTVLNEYQPHQLLDVTATTDQHGVHLVVTFDRTTEAERRDQRIRLFEFEFGPDGRFKPGPDQC